MDLILKFIYKYLFLIAINFINFSYFQIDTFAGEEISNGSESIGKNINSTSKYEMDYLLGSGDVLFIEFEELEIFSGIYAVNAEGFVLLPEIKKLYVNGLTIKELELLLAKSYKETIINPIINVSINNYRTVNFYLAGEINSPGFYSLGYSTNNVRSENVSNNKFSERLLQNPAVPSLKFNLGNTNLSPKIGVVAPTLFDALKKGNGLTNFADLSKIKVIRKNSLSNGGGKIQANIDLLPMIQYGDQSNNIRIMDGDSIIIPKNEKPIKEQILAIYKTNLSPDVVTVFITGNVEDKGPITIKKGSGLIQAIASSGGKKLLTGNLEFIRFNDDGSTKRIKFNYDPNAKLNSAKNPILMDGDVINVEKTLLGSTTEILSEFSTPLLSGFGIYQIFK